MIGPGSRLAHYEILEAIGKGGMGEVWRARDAKLGREVAIKTLPPEFAEDPDRLARFEREARLLASLNHPNIAAIYGLEEHEGSQFLVLELVDGDTLGDRITRGPIPVEESLQRALQIADALKAAHESGVVHRDLKPDNIKVSDDGNVKVLDFGLAKALSTDEADVNISNFPTLSMAATQAGVILGTAAYMSPEQAKGRTVDRRTDVWAFGCVLFEMLSGQRSFGKSDVTESLSAVISLQPDWDALPRNLHPRLRETLERCLEKKPTSRYQDIGDVKLDIERLLADPQGVVVQPVAHKVQAARQSKLAWITAAIGIGIASTAVWVLKPEDPGRVVRFEHRLPEGLDFRSTNRTAVAVSPDGDEVVYNTASGVYRLSVADFDSRVIPGTEDITVDLTFSPDGQWLAYWSGATNQLQKISVNGGAPVFLVSVASPPIGMSWGEDDTIVYSDGGTVMRVSASGGDPEVLLAGTGGLYPEMLPGGRAFLFQSGSQVSVKSLDDAPQSLFPGS